jgi:hypothetical protein
MKDEFPPRLPSITLQAWDQLINEAKALLLDASGDVNLASAYLAADDLVDRAAKKDPTIAEAVKRVKTGTPPRLAYMGAMLALSAQLEVLRAKLEQLSKKGTEDEATLR